MRNEKKNRVSADAVNAFQLFAYALAVTYGRPNRLVAKILGPDPAAISSAQVVCGEPKVLRTVR